MSDQSQLSLRCTVHEGGGGGGGDGLLIYFGETEYSVYCIQQNPE